VLQVRRVHERLFTKNNQHWWKHAASPISCIDLFASPPILCALFLKRKKPQNLSREYFTQDNMRFIMQNASNVKFFIGGFLLVLEQQGE